MNRWLKAELGFILAVIGLGAIVRFVFISQASIWHDEGYTMMLAPQGPGEILARTARDVHPPGHYLTLHYWMELFGNSELAARSLSAVFMLGTILLGYLLVKRLFDESSARLAALFLALAPFLVRYSQEARMYAMVAFLLTLATWLLVKASQDGKKGNWYLYGLVMSAALYTHYYAIFMIAVHWLYVLIQSRRKGNQGLFNPHWWGGNVLAAGLFLPWVPIAYAQFSRVQAAFWIPPVGPHTLPNTIAQFLTYTDLGVVPLALRLIGFAAFVALIAAGLWLNRKKVRELILILAFATLAPLVVFLLSFGRPIYIDRYFVFAAVGFYCLLGVLFYLKPLRQLKLVRSLLVVALCATLVVGIRNVYSQSNHRMRDVARIVNNHFEPGDLVISGELYTYFDFSYYNQTGETLKLLAPDGITGYGETSLLYDRADQIVVRDYAELDPASGHVWVIGKAGQKDYFTKVPTSWTAVGPHYSAGYVAAQRYQVNAPRLKAATAPVILSER